MAWTETTRARYERHSGRYASDLTDQEWGLIAPFLPPRISQVSVRRDGDSAIHEVVAYMERMTVD